MADFGQVIEIILYVEDMAAQVAFYRDTLGLQVKVPSDVEDFSQVHWVELDTGACTLALHGGGQRRFGKDAPKFVFRVADVPSARDALRAQGVQMGAIRSPEPDINVCDGQDPEGNWFSIESRPLSDR
jgi:catechol 2,3-dioxygenase-like lactoylglutathione lyase family enzyme